MKNLSLLFALCLLVTVGANAQEFKKFKVGVGAGYAMPGGKGAKGGLLWTLEPSYRVSDALAIGLRIEGAILVRGFSEELGDDAEFDIAAISSYTVNGNYYLNNNNFRPFVGAGLGIYSLAAVELKDSDNGGDAELSESESKFGFYPRIGFDAGHFTLALEYNLIPATKVDGLGGEFKNSYLGIRIGGFFGGGRK
ncbi:MAG TPA: outer membrane beta-barrel protein [Ohtaekwangia sp.]|nr:outer membrane beta-barrel protein [Ohtaekwangia sp.]